MSAELPETECERCKSKQGAVSFHLSHTGHLDQHGAAAHPGSAPELHTGISGGLKTGERDTKILLTPPLGSIRVLSHGQGAGHTLSSGTWKSTL